MNKYFEYLVALDKHAKEELSYKSFINSIKCFFIYISFMFIMSLNIKAYRVYKKSHY